jgi:beta-lactamase regulating signal transducer with metallopeptidase domain
MFWWLAQNTLMAAALAALVALLCRLGRFRPSVRHALWLVVLIKLLMPPGVQWPWPLPPVGSTSGSMAVVPSELHPLAESVLSLGDVPELLLVHEEALPAAGEVSSLRVETDPVAAPSAEHSAETAATDWRAVSVALWLAGTLSLAVVQAIRIMRFRRLLARTHSAPSWLVSQLKEQAAKLGVRPPALRVVPDLGSPLLWSLGRPQLLWPASLLEGLPAHCRRSVLVHELAHLRRRDHWVGWLLLLAECVWWWNPLFWYVRRQLHQNAELACDAWVVAMLPGDRRAYAEALLEVSQLVSRVAAPVPALGMSRGPRQTFERRLTMIMRERVPCRLPFGGCLAIGLLTLIALPGWSLGQKADEPKKEPPPANYYYVPVTDPTVPSGARYEVFVQTPPTALQAQPAAGTERERKLQDLERKLEVLLNEVKALRGANPAAPLPTMGASSYPTTPPPAVVPPPASGVRYQLAAPPYQLTAPQQVVPVPVVHRREFVFNQPAGDAAMMLLSRATYKLPRAKAEALAAFLREHVKARVLENAVEGNSLIVTTTPEAQAAIGQMIALMQGSSSPRPPATKAAPEAATPAADKPQFFFRLQEKEQDTQRSPINKLEREPEEKSDQPRRP